MDTTSEKLTTARCRVFASVPSGILQWYFTLCVPVYVHEMHIVCPIKSYDAHDSQVSDTSHLRDVRTAPSSAFFGNVIFKYCETKCEMCHHHFNGYGRSQGTSASEVTLSADKCFLHWIKGRLAVTTHMAMNNDDSLYEPHRIFTHVRNMSHELKGDWKRRN